MRNKRGAFVISLDFELMWGCMDHKSIEDYGNQVKGVWTVMPKMLHLFEEKEIHATWAIVGLMTRDSVNDCIKNKPICLPSYADKNLSTYEHYEEISEWDKQYLFAKELIEKIKEVPKQEIASHTYSHYYCAEPGQTKDSFRADICLAQNVFKEYVDKVSTLIFPRNQVNDDYIDIIKDAGIHNYRGNEKAWFYKADSNRVNNRIHRRLLRLVDCYLNIFGHHCYDYSDIRENSGLNNIRSSRFFRPYSKSLAFLEPLRIHRIKTQMRCAAKNGKVFHIWWHPHNFGVDIEQNMNNLQIIISYYEYLKEKYGMVSLNMHEIEEIIS